MLADRRQAWDLDGEGVYVQRQPVREGGGEGDEEGVQAKLMRLAGTGWVEEK